MKRLILTIFFTIIAINFAYAGDYVAPFTVKPDILPGVDLVENGSTDGRELTNSTIPKLAVRIVGIGAAVALIFFVIAGVRYMMSYTDDDTHNKSKEQIINVAVGLLVAVFAYTIVSIVVNIKF